MKLIAVLVKSLKTTEKVLVSRKHHGCIVVAIQNPSVNQEKKSFRSDNTVTTIFLKPMSTV